MFTGPVGPVEVFFYWPGAIGSPLASSPASTKDSPTQYSFRWTRNKDFSCCQYEIPALAEFRYKIQAFSIIYFGLSYLSIYCEACLHHEIPFFNGKITNII